MKQVALGLDTSNYRTSLAVISLDGEILFQSRELLPVARGERGLRQSDAVYLHLKQLKAMDIPFRNALKDCQPVVVSASCAPRGRSDSYMPVFEAGETAGRMMASALQIPFVPSDHQHGHLRAALFQTSLEGCSQFLGLHLSGGTTDLLHIQGERVEPLGSSLDLHAGQLIDRIGVALGLDFPAGPALERLAEGGVSSGALGCSMDRGDTCCHFSGAEARALGWVQRAEKKPEDIAREIYDLLARTISRMLIAGEKATGEKQALVCGGVASSPLFRRMLQERMRKTRSSLHLTFGAPELSGDNAVGIALIGLDYLKQKQERCTDPFPG